MSIATCVPVFLSRLNRSEQLSALRQSASVDDPFGPGDLTICDNCLFLREHILQPAITTMYKKCRTSVKVRHIEKTLIPLVGSEDVFHAKTNTLRIRALRDAGEKVRTEGVSGVHLIRDLRCKPKKFGTFSKCITVTDRDKASL